MQSNNPYASSAYSDLDTVPSTTRTRWLAGLCALAVVVALQYIDGLYYSGAVFGMLFILAIFKFRLPFFAAILLHTLGVIVLIAAVVQDPAALRILGMTLNLCLLVVLIQAIPPLWSIVGERKNRSTSNDYVP